MPAYHNRSQHYEHTMVLKPIKQKKGLSFSSWLTRHYQKWGFLLKIAILFGLLYLTFLQKENKETPSEAEKASPPTYFTKK